MYYIFARGRVENFKLKYFRPRAPYTSYTYTYIIIYIYGSGGGGHRDIYTPSEYPPPPPPPQRRLRACVIYVRCET